MTTKKQITAAAIAGYEHAQRTDLPKGHNVLKYASDKYPTNTRLFEAFLKGYDTASQE